jgi:hypothetical protein
MRGGFYPAHPAAVAHAATFLRSPLDQAFSILDPCAGEGAAIQQLGEMLSCPQERTFAIELDDDRAERLLAMLPEGHVLAPASFFGCRASWASFSCIWLNPPFDHSYGGHRVEERFLHQATDWLMPGGVMALVFPEDVVGEYSDARRYFATYYEHCTIVPFPERHRPFREVVVFAHKRPRLMARADHQGREPSWDAVQAPKGFVYWIPHGDGPRVFQKVEPTERELRHMLARSPLRTYLTAPPEVPLAAPPLALGIGHVALLLASGHLNGVVAPEGQPPHVVRGTARKREYVSDVSEIENDDGSTTTRTTISERIELIVRTVDLAGNFQTFGDTSEGGAKEA